MTSETLINWILNTGIDVSLLIVLVLICRRPFIRLFGARSAYSLWALPLIRFVLPDMSLSINRPDWLGTIPVISDKIALPMNMETLGTAPVNTAMSSPFNWQIALISIWLCIAVLWLVVNLWKQHKYVRSLYLNSKPVSPAVQDKVSQAAKTLNLTSVFRVRMGQENTGPLVTGIFKPLVILPPNFETAYSERQQVFALTHELAHIKRRDLWAAFMSLVFRSLNWPNPLVHFVAGKFRADQEAACDAYVLDIIGGGTTTKQNYAATLIHSAKLTRTTQGETGAAHPLCLTIYHPLKERLMTLKSSRTKPGILAKLGIATFLVAALTATAPLTIASATDSSDNAEQSPTKMKKVLKWVENINGVETEKSYEIITENGVTTAYSLDEHGNKTVVNISEIENMGGTNDMSVFVMGDHAGQKHVKIMSGSQMPHGLKGDGTHGQVFIKRITKGQNGEVLTEDDNVFVMGHGGQASALVSAAQELLGQASNMDSNIQHSNKVKRKLEKARKALQEAQEALEADEG